ncbi:MAG: hypothetical protein KatS3mg051_2060 [Anaerolineae bacterium]|nr:MAG: hypothetical protein KatS3mg051_1689 [Anaerolineae bacterium]GIV82544.1 MAG: hypothetical protein KatS3mg051_1898 [Anaerolineae bacterium]GIV82706.1 MAG: hypothetical protein KatS3mg051_2060 [Anaerolineae bacterium]
MVFVERIRRMYRLCVRAEGQTRILRSGLTAQPVDGGGTRTRAALQAHADLLNQMLRSGEARIDERGFIHQGGRYASPDCNHCPVRDSVA